MTEEKFYQKPPLSLLPETSSSAFSAGPQGSFVSLRGMLDEAAGQTEEMAVPLLLGRRVSDGQCVVEDLAALPHLLLAGNQGSGVDMCVDSLLMGLLYLRSPEEVRLMLADPKIIQLAGYQGIPHLLAPVIPAVRLITWSLELLGQEIQRRHDVFSQMEDCPDITAYHALADRRQAAEKMPYIVYLLDELADEMIYYPQKMEAAICGITKLGKSVGVHLILTTRRAAPDVMTDPIAAAFPAKAAFAVRSETDSRLILQTGGAEALAGRGDMLYKGTETGQPVRMQTFFVPDKSVELVTRDIRQRYEGFRFCESLTESLRSCPYDRASEPVAPFSDDQLQQAMELARRAGKVSTSMLQRNLRIGYSRANRLVDALVEMRVVTPSSKSATLTEYLYNPEHSI